MSMPAFLIQSVHGQTWAEFASLEAAVFMLYAHVSVEPNSQAQS
jgi:hypothetical protein